VSRSKLILRYPTAASSQGKIAQAPDEGLGEGVLHRLARRDVVPVDFVIVGPSLDGIRGKVSGQVM
jgi:hypothetical protein